MPSHPIALRLEMLAVQWASFAAHPEARLMRWRCLPDELPMLDAFVAREDHSEACVTADVFLRFDDAFENPSAHGFALCESFRDAYDEARPALAQEGIEADFMAPTTTQGDDVAAFVALLKAYFEHLAGEADHIVAYLQPASVRDVSAYQLWLQRLVHACPECVRVVVLDDDVEPQCEALAKCEPTRVETVRCGLEVQDALQALARDSDNGTPGAKFRELFVQLGGMAKQGDVVRAVPLARTATDVALTMGCPHLAAGVQMLLASIHVQTQQPLEALTCYAEVDRLGHATFARSEAKPGSGELDSEQTKLYGLRLRRDARLGQGAVLIAQRAWAHGAKVYTEASTLSRLLRDPLSELDGLRLASFCHEQLGKRDEAWQCGMKGLEVGAALEPAARASSTLGYLGDSMLRLTHSSTHSAFRDVIREHMDKLLGRGWRERLLQPVQAARP